MTVNVLYKQIEGDHLEDPGVNGRIILKLIFDRLDEGHELDRCGLGYGQTTCSCKCGIETSGSIKCEEFLQ